MLISFLDESIVVNIEHDTHTAFGDYGTILVVICYILANNIKDSLLVNFLLFFSIYLLSHFLIYTYIYKMIRIFLVAFLLCRILHKHELFFILYARVLLENFLHTTWLYFNSWNDGLSAGKRISPRKISAKIYYLFCVIFIINKVGHSKKIKINMESAHQKPPSNTDNLQFMSYIQLFWSIIILSRISTVHRTKDIK